MPVGFNRRIPDNPLLRLRGGARLPATLGESVEASALDPRNFPTGRIGTAIEIEEERGTPRGNFPGPPGQSVTDPEPPDEEDLSPLVQPEALNERYKDLNLKFDRPERENVARILAEQKREDLVREDVLARGPRGPGAVAAQLGATFAASALDPVNIASAFIPVVSQARFAGWAARMGTTRARMLAGTVEGTVGAAVTEPIVYELSRQQQLDYEFSDAAVNVAFGGLLGGGLHAAAGRIGDFIRSRSPETREAAMRTALAQAAQGRQIDVESVYRMPDRGFRRESPRAADLQSGVSTAALSRGFDVETARAALPDERTMPFIGPEPIEPAAVVVPSVTRQGELRAFDTQREAETAIRGMQARQGLRAIEMPDGRFAIGRDRPDVELERKPDGTVQRFPNRRAARKHIDRVRGGDEDLRVVPLGDSNFGVARGLTAKDVADIEAAPQAARFADVPKRQFEPAIRQIEDPQAAIREVTRAARMNAMPERDLTADFEASARVAENLDKIPGEVEPDSAQNEAEYARRLVDDLMEQNLLDEADMRTVGDLDAFTERSQAWGRAARQAAVCMSRNA